jgi:hypothetical protein
MEDILEEWLVPWFERDGLPDLYRKVDIYRFPEARFIFRGCRYDSAFLRQHGRVSMVAVEGSMQKVT